MTTDEQDNSKIIDLEPDQVTVEKDESPAAPPVTRRKSTLMRFALPAGGLLVAILAGGWLYREVVSDYYPTDRVAAALERTATLEKSNGALQLQVQALEKLSTQLGSDLNAIETKSTAVGSLAKTLEAGLESTDARVAGLASGLAESQQQMADLAKIPPPATDGAGGGDPAALAALAARLAALEKDVESLKAQKGQTPDFTTLSQSLADLKAKIAAGTGYLAELQRIQRMVPAAAGLEVLATHADAGLPDAKGLATELTTLATTFPKPQVVVPSTAEDSYLTQAWNMMSDLIKVRNTGEVDWQAAAATAAALAEAGDLAGAMAGLNGLEGSKPTGLTQWLERAAGRIAMEAALQSVEDGVLRTLASQKANG